MPKLIDELRGKEARIKKPWLVREDMESYWAQHVGGIAEMLRDPQLPVIVIDNVAEYFYAGTDQEQWSLDRDFPNLAPPFPQFWMEYRMARKIHSKECGDTDMSRMLPRSGRIGQLYTVIDPQEVQACEVPAHTKWALWVELFIDFGERECTCQGTHGSILVMVDAEGRSTGVPRIINMGTNEDEPILKALMSWLHPALLAVSFMHCRNVTVVENPIPPKLQKRYQERHEGAGLGNYKTLVIEPLKQVLRSQGRSGEVGLAKAMHVCRGHFRDYREGKGLFGKYHQLVWTPAVVRGTRGKEAPPRVIEVKL